MNLPREMNLARAGTLRARIDQLTTEIGARICQRAELRHELRRVESALEGVEPGEACLALQMPGHLAKIHP